MAVGLSSGRVTADISGNVNVSPVGNAAAYAGLKNTSRSFSGGTTTDTVPAGKVWIVQSATVPYSGVAASCRLVQSGVNKEIIGITVAATTGQSWTGQVKLIAGDTASVTYAGIVTYYEIDA